MRTQDAIKAYQAVQMNGWGARDALKAAGMVFSSGGFSGLGNSWRNEYWPNTFNKLTDPWPVRAGITDLNAFWGNSTAQACLSWIQRTFIEPPVWVVKGQGADAEEQKRHPLTRLLNRPNPHYTRERMWQVTLADWWMTGQGNAYWKKVRGRDGKPVELWHVPAAEIEPKWPKDGSDFISYYERTVNGQREEIEPKDIVHFRFGQDPANQRKGWSPVGAAWSEIGILNEGANYRQSILGNQGVPSYALTPKEEAVARQMTPEKSELISKLFTSKFGGSNRASGLFIPNFVADLARVGFSPQELDIRQMLEWDSETVCSLFGLNAMILGLPSGNGQRTYSNQADAREGAFRSNIIPSQQLIGADLGLYLLPEFGDTDDLYVGFDYSRVGVLQEDQNALWERLDNAWAKGAITREEAKQGKGLKPDPRVDKVYFIPSTGTLVPADETPEEREAKQMEKDAAEQERAQQQLAALPESSGDAAAQREAGRGEPATKALPLPQTVTLTRRDVQKAEASFAEAVGVEFGELLEAEASE